MKSPGSKAKLHKGTRSYKHARTPCMIFTLSLKKDCAQHAARRGSKALLDQNLSGENEQIILRGREPSSCQKLCAAMTKVSSNFKPAQQHQAISSKEPQEFFRAIKATN